MFQLAGGIDTSGEGDCVTCTGGLPKPKKDAILVNVDIIYAFAFFFSSAALMVELNQSIEVILSKWANKIASPISGL